MMINGRMVKVICNKNLRNVVKLSNGDVRIVVYVGGQWHYFHS